MKIEENNIQTFCGKDLFKWESWDEVDTGTSGYPQHFLKITSPVTCII